MNENEVVMPSYPANLHYLTERLVGQFRNHFQIFPQSSTSVGANRKLVFTLPENSIVDLASIQLIVKKVSTTAKVSSVGANPVVVGLVPQLQSLIQTCNVFVNGIQLDNSMPEWNTAYFLKNCLEGSTQKFNEVDDLQCAKINTQVPTGDREKGESRAGVIANWLGLIGNESSTRFLDTSLTGAIRIELMTAPDSVLPVTNGTTAPNVALVADIQTAGIGYTIQDFHMAVDTMDLSDGIYDAMLRQRLSDQRELFVNYKSYYSLTNNAGTADNSTTRWSVSSQSIDKVYGTNRLTTYNQFPVATDQGCACLPEPPNGSFTNYSGAPITDFDVNGATQPSEKDQFCPRFQYFENFNVKGTQPGGSLPPYDSQDATLPDGTYQYQFTINNVSFPQMLTGEAECAGHAVMASEKWAQHADGSKIATQLNYSNGRFCAVARLSHPTDGDSPSSCRVISGLDSRGVNSAMTFRQLGQDKVKEKSVYCLTETTATLRISAGKQISVVF